MITRKNSQRRMFFLGAVLLAVACGLPTGGPAEDVGQKASALTGMVASFDWTVPERLKLDGDNNFVAIDPNPSQFPVNLDACASGPAGTITEFRWSFGDGTSATVASCATSHAYPSEGTFSNVTLTVAAADGSTATITKDITVQDFLVVGLGDSYGSGEGSPNKEIPPSVLQRWVDLGVQLGQLGNDLNHANDVLGALDQMLGPTEDFIGAFNANEAGHCVVCSPDGLEEDICFAACGWPLNPACCLPCKSGCRDLAENLAKATLDFHVALGKVVLVEGLQQLKDFENDPTGLKDKIQDLKNVWNATKNAILDSIGKLRGERDLIPNTENVKWQDKQCHRSTFAAQAQAALKLEQSDPKTSVTFVHLACSGAKLEHLLTSNYEGVDPSAGSPVPPQITAAKTQIGNREVDAVLLSVGGNDANFSPIIFAGIAQEPTHMPDSPLFVRVDEAALGVKPLCDALFFFTGKCTQYFDIAVSKGLGPPGLDLFRDGVKLLPDGYTALRGELSKAFTSIARDSRRVFITPYPDATQDETGAPCSPRADRLPAIQDLPGWSTSEWIWAGQTVIPGINEEIRKAASDNAAPMGIPPHPWTLVPGVFASFGSHGLCSDDNWVNRLQQSLEHQGDASGTVHPNRSGYAIIAQSTFDVLKAQLYSAADGTPREPQVPPVADAGGTWIVDEGSEIALVNRTLNPVPSTTLGLQWSLSALPPNGAELVSPTSLIPTLRAIDDTTGVITLDATNAFGTSHASATLVVRNVAPTVQALPPVEAITGGTFTLTTTFVDPGLNDTHTATIDWGDGQSSNVVVPTNSRAIEADHVYVNPGTFIAQITVRDDDGGVGTGTVSINACNFSITAPRDITISVCVGANIGAPTVVNSCAPITPSSNAPAKFPLGTTVVTWTARNASGNIKQDTQVVTAVLGDDPSCCPTGTHVIIGTNGSDRLIGTSGNDCILGRGGDDVIDGRGGNDAISGGSGRDTIMAGNGDDRIYGGDGDDTINAGLGSNYINGGPGADTCFVNPGHDVAVSCNP